MGKSLIETRRAGQKPEDFASAAMMRLIALGLQKQGIDISPQKPSGAHIARAEKRDLLTDVLVRHGPLAIVRIADCAPLMPLEPVVRALRQAHNASDLLDRWSRLERFSHARHTIVHSLIAPDTYRLHHRARDGGPQPSKAESLLMLSLLPVLMEQSGARLVLETEEGVVLRSGGEWHQPPSGQDLRSVTVKMERSDAQQSRPVSQATEALVEHLRGHVSGDPCRRWSVDDMAQLLGTSRRTLQRRLTEKQKSFSEIVLDMRLELAADHLCNDTRESLAQIGFLTGFSDQPHFTRNFVREVGVTPGLYREYFMSNDRRPSKTRLSSPPD